MIAKSCNQDYGNHFLISQVGGCMRQVLLFILFVVVFVAPQLSFAQYGANLLTNPGAESEYTGWTKTDGGTGWNTTFRTARTGAKSWASSFQNCTLTQTVDLLAQGYTSGALGLHLPFQ
jgi:hypothetical protein